jgi:hypothetical protein
MAVAVLAALVAAVAWRSLPSSGAAREAVTPAKAGGPRG